MLDLVFILTITLLIFFISIILFSFSIGSFDIRKLNLVSYLFYKDVILFSLVGVVLVVLQLDNKLDLYFWAITNQLSEGTRHIGWVAVLYFIIAFPIGMIAGNLIVCKRIKSYPILHYISKESSEKIRYMDDAFFISFILFSLAAFISVAYVYLSLDRVPILALVKGADASTLAVLRGDAKISFSGSVRIRDMLALKLPVLLSYIAYAQHRLTDKIKWKHLFLCLFALSFFALTYNLQKAPFLFYLIGFVIIKVIIGDQVSKKTLTALTLIISIGLIFSFTFIMGSETLENLLVQLSQRIFIAQTSAIFLAFEYFPKYNEFLGLSSISGVLSELLNQDKLYYGRVLFELYNPDAVESGKAGYIVGNLIAESWALFGFKGAVFLPMWAGFVVSVVSNILLKLPKHSSFIGLYAYMALNFSITGGVAQFLNSVVLLSPVFYVISLLLCSYFIKKQFQKKR